VGSGINGQFGVASEATGTPGTPVAASRFFRYTGESMQLNVHDYRSKGIGGSLVMASGERVLTYSDGSGGLTLDVPIKGFGPILKQALGSATSGIPVQQAATTAYLQTHVMPSRGGQNSMSLTVQKGVDDDTSTKPFTFGGCKVDTIEFDCKIGGGLTCKVTFDAMNVMTPTAATGVGTLQTATYLTQKVYHFGSFQALTLGGTATTALGVTTVTGASVPASLIKGLKLKIDWGMATDRISIVGGISKKEQLINDRPKITGSLTGEFTNVTELFDLFRLGTNTALSIVMRSDLIASTYYHELRFLLPAVQFTSDTPQVTGYDIVELDSDFEGTYDGTNPPLQIQYQSTETTAAL
jgi:hypothetical protein